jgi:autotransporter-associated beta strand protein
MLPSPIKLLPRANPSRKFRCNPSAFLAVAAAAPLAQAQIYSSEILYPLSPPAGFQYQTVQDAGTTGSVGQAYNLSGFFEQNVTAILWTPAGPVSLNPTNLGSITASQALAIGGSQQVGSANGPATGGNNHAILWTGSGSTAVDLNPTNLTGFSSSVAQGTDGSQQVGFGLFTPSGPGPSSANNHALLWNGTASGAVDLNPAGFTSSSALNTDGAQQVGYGTIGQLGNNVALLWSSSATGAINLNPTNLTGITSSEAEAVSGNQQVGFGSGSGISGDYHALLWTGSANSTVDLNPTNLTGFSSSLAEDTNGSQQVGFGYGSGTNYDAHALVWSATPNSAVDLQPLLPSTGAWTNSYATAIDASGNVFGDAYGTFGNVTGIFAVEWSAIDLIWNNAGAAGDGVHWDTSNQNWNNGDAPTVYADNSSVLFNDTNNGNYAITISAPVTPSSVLVNNTAGNYSFSGPGSIAGSGSLTKQGIGSLTLATVNSYTGGTTVSAGTLLVQVSGALPSGEPLTIASAATVRLLPSSGLQTLGSLSIAAGGVFDIANNHLIVDYTTSDPISAIHGYLSAGFNNGNWNGPGIISSTAQTPTNSFRYGVGFADGADGIVSGISSGQIEVKYTLLGDANLDGTVNGADFSILAANFGLGYTNWDQGNFLFTPAVNGADFSALAANFGQGDSGADVAVPPADIAALDAFANANGLSMPAIDTVPEPTSLGLMAVSLTLIPRRRRP